jgi:hypothetical protein
VTGVDLDRAGRGLVCDVAMKQRSLDRLRLICLALPEAEERETWGEPTFRVREKIFCMHRSDTGWPALWCKAPPGSQAILIGADPGRFFVPPYVGPNGWIGMRLDRRVDLARGRASRHAQLSPDRAEAPRCEPPERLRQLNTYLATIPDFTITTTFSVESSSDSSL